VVVRAGFGVRFFPEVPYESFARPAARIRIQGTRSARRLRRNRRQQHQPWWRV